MQQGREEVHVLPVRKIHKLMKVAYLNCKQSKSYSKEGDIDSMLGNIEKLNEIQFTTLSDVTNNEFADNANFFDNNEDTAEISVTVSTTKDRDGIIVNSLVSRMSSIQDPSNEAISKV